MDVLSYQEALGLDILVHGEAERTDMVEFFGQQLEGFAFTLNGWVQVCWLVCACRLCYTRSEKKFHPNIKFY